MGLIKNVKLQHYLNVMAVIALALIIIFAYQNFSPVNPQTCDNHASEWSLVDQFTYSKAFTAGGVTFEGHLDSIQISGITTLQNQELIYILGHGDSGILAGNPTPSRKKRLFARAIPSMGFAKPPVSNTLDLEPHFFQGAKVDYNGNVFAVGFGSAGRWRSRVFFSNPNPTTADRWFENPDVVLANDAEPSDSRFSASTIFAEGQDGDIFMAVRSQTGSPQVVTVLRRKNTDGAWRQLHRKDYGAAHDMNIFFRDAGRFLYVFATGQSTEIARAHRIDPSTVPNATVVEMTAFNTVAFSKKFKILDGFYDNFQGREQAVLAGWTMDAQGVTSAAVFRNGSLRADPATQVWAQVIKTLAVGKDSKFMRLGRDRDGRLYAFGNGFDASNQLKHFVMTSLDAGSTWSALHTGCEPTGLCRDIALAEGTVRDVMVWQGGTAFSNLKMGGGASVADLASVERFENVYGVTPLYIIPDQRGQLWALTDSPQSTVPLTDGTEKILKVFKLACNAQGAGPPWPAPTPNAGTPLNPALMMNLETDRQIQFKWNHVGGVLYYKVKRQKDGESGFTEFPSLVYPKNGGLPIGDGAVMIFTDTQLQNNVKHRYAIYGVSPDGVIGLDSNVLELTPNIPPPVKPGLSLTAGDKQITISIATVAFGVRYRIERKAAPETIFTPLVTVTSSSQVDGGLINGTTYSYRVIAINAENEESVPSDEKSAVPQPPPPPPVKPFKPTGLSASSPTWPPPSKVNVVWGAISGHDGFKLYRKKPADPGFIPMGGVIPLSQTNFVDSDVVKSEAITYRLVTLCQGVLCTNATKQESDPAEITFTVPVLVPPAPANSQAVVQSSPLAVNVTWSSVVSAESYAVFRTKNGGPQTQVKPAPGEQALMATAFTDTDITQDPVSNTSYSYCIKAIFEGQASPCSTMANIVIPPPPPVPTLGSCIVASEDLAASMPPGFFAPQSGVGYQKSNLDTGKLDELHVFCSEGVFEELMRDYCRVNNKPAQWCEVVYFASGTQGGTSCKTNKNDILEKHQCPQEAVSSAKGPNADIFDTPQRKQNHFNSAPTCNFVAPHPGDDDGAGMGGAATALVFLLLPSFLAISLRRPL